MRWRVKRLKRLQARINACSNPRKKARLQQKLQKRLQKISGQVTKLPSFRAFTKTQN